MMTIIHWSMLSLLLQCVCHRVPGEFPIQAATGNYQLIDIVEKALIRHAHVSSV
jgi:hypothetical protein